ncbi:uncharacterized protein LOC131850646 [Achroia grisella]|uniref:uncharacterized protein LOC131850646 n=1 Tax=Achroia grisella TaxID=688607 RepID=UPI0027D2CD7A|nr:uncharacterized protein LOC131850646 [Achroia grisella]
MFNISCYAVHPIIKRFITLWRYAQAVSDCLTFALSVLCCQCWEMMPISAASGEQASIEAFKIVPVVDAGRSTGESLKAQHLVLDFTPKAEDNEEVQRRCLRLWDLAQQTHLERTTVQTLVTSGIQLKNPPVFM